MTRLWNAYFSLLDRFVLTPADEWAKTYLSMGGSE